MTMMQHVLLRLRGDRSLESYAAEWGNKWEDRAARICELNGCTQWDSPGLADGGSKEAQLDWGAFAYEMSLDEIRELLPPRRRLNRQHAMLDRLDPAGRYAVVWVECY